MSCLLRTAERRFRECNRSYTRERCGLILEILAAYRRGECAIPEPSGRCFLRSEVCTATSFVCKGIELFDIYRCLYNVPYRSEVTLVGKVRLCPERQSFHCHEQWLESTLQV